MKTLIEKLLGVNWRTTLRGIRTTASVLCGVWLTLPPEMLRDPRVWVPAVIAALLKTVGDANGKDRQVSGTPGTGTIVGTKGEEPRIIDPNQPRP